MLMTNKPFVGHKRHTNFHFHITDRLASSNLAIISTHHLVTVLMINSNIHYLFVMQLLYRNKKTRERLGSPGQILFLSTCQTTACKIWSILAFLNPISAYIKFFKNGNFPPKCHFTA